MKKDTIAEEYLDRIDEELSGLDRKLRLSVIEELRGHITEKSETLARKSGKEEVDEKILENVIENLGEPHDVASEYIKTLPKRPDRGIKAFLFIQLSVGIFSMLIGIDLLYFGVSWYQKTMSPTNRMLYTGDALFCALFLATGLIIFMMIILQFRRPSLIRDYGSFSVIISLVAGIGGLTTSLEFVLWDLFEKGFHETAFYAIISPVIILLVLGYLLGLGHMMKFQKLLAAEKIEEEKLTGRIEKRTKVMAASVAILVILFSISGIFMYTYSDRVDTDSELLDTEYIGGEYDATIERWGNYVDGRLYENYKIVYYMNKTQVDGVFDPKDRPTLNWLKDNTPENATIMSWWDYGHMIRAYANREPVIDYPSSAILNTVAEVAVEGKSWDKPLCPEETVKDVALAFTTDDSNFTKQMMQKYNASYILTFSRDAAGIAYAFFTAAEKDPANYMDMITNQPSEDGEKAFLFKVWSGKQVDGFELVYSDIISRVYKPIY
ncbi:MAG: hypothetical protein JSV56_06060 [Methanomassiliicoccales archaeon]|nr:MAG: hypothetical protein JSV56_06060 [Methanomassiliicoccales archaeon]